jgi:glyoxylase-like metal-dependent hydrolase (beta-lactamase superfamily II)
MPLFSKRIAGWCAVASLVVAAPVVAQSDLTIDPVRDGLFVLTGDGGNVAVRVTTDGVILVDAGLRGRFSEVERLVASKTQEPIRQVVITHMHPDHTGGLTEIPADVEVIGHSETRDLMRRAGFAGEPRTVFDDELTLDAGDAEVRILHLGAGHTGGDAVVYFPDARAVHVGDLLHELAPFIDYAQGGSSAGWVAALDRVLELDFDVAIAGHGQVMTRDAVAAFRDQMEAVRARMREMIDRGALRRDVGPGLTSTNLTWTQYRGSPLFRSLAGLYDEVLAEMMQSGFRPHPGQFQN